MWNFKKLELYLSAHETVPLSATNSPEEKEK
jgi:hypothetical protein